MSLASVYGTQIYAYVPVEDLWKVTGWHHTKDNRVLHGVELESTGTLSGILLCLAMSLASVCGTQIYANVFLRRPGERSQEASII